MTELVPGTITAFNKQIIALRASLLSMWVPTFLKFMPIADVRALQNSSAHYWTVTHDQLFGDEHGLQKGSEKPTAAFFRDQDRGIPKHLGVTSQQCSTAINRAGLLKSQEIVPALCPYRQRGPNTSGSKFHVGVVYDASPPEQLVQNFRQAKGELEKSIRGKADLLAQRRKKEEPKPDPGTVECPVRAHACLNTCRVLLLQPRSSLQTLNLHSTAVTDVSALASCLSLHTPHLSCTNVTDVSALASCMTDVTALASCTKVTGVPALAVKLAVAQHQGICTATLPQNW